MGYGPFKHLIAKSYSKKNKEIVFRFAECWLIHLYFGSIPKNTLILDDLMCGLRELTHTLPLANGFNSIQM